MPGPRRFGGALTHVAFAVGLGLPAGADAAPPPERQWAVRATGSLTFVPQDAVTVPVSGSGPVTSATLDFGTGLAVGLMGEYRVSRLLGITLDVTGIVLDSEITYETNTQPIQDESPVAGQFPILAGATFHVLDPASRFDLQLSALAGVVVYSTAEVRNVLADQIKADAQFGMAADVTLNYLILEPGLFLALDARVVVTRLLTSVQLQNGLQTAAFDVQATPVLLGLGVGYRF